MRRVRAVVIALALLASTGGVATSAGAGAVAKLLVQVFKHGDEAAEAAAGAAKAERAAAAVAQADRATLEAAREAARAAEAVIGVNGPMSRTEREQWSRAYRDMQARLPMDTLHRDMAAFDTLVQTGLKSSDHWTDAVAYSSDLPFLKVKVPAADTIESRTLLAFAHARLDAVLRGRFDTKDVKIVSLALADSRAASVAEVAAFRRTIPHANWDEFGFLAQIRDGAQVDDATKLTRLRPYRGKTVIMVGHVPRGTADFFVHGATGPRAVDIQGWIRAANEAGVNLIPIGCDSGDFANLGAAGIVNSAKVRRQLREVLLAEPRTMADFLKRLTGADLTLTMNPLDTHLFANGLEIAGRKGEPVGRLVLQGARAAPRFQSMAEPTPGYPVDPCFAEGSATGFNTCIGTAQKKVDLAAQRQEQLYRTTAETLRALRIAEAEQDIRNLRPWRTVAVAGYVVALAFMIYLYLIKGVARREEQDVGARIAQLFSRHRVLDAGDRLWMILRHPRAGFRDLFNIGLLLAIALPLVLNEPSTWVYLFYSFVALCIGVTIWDKLKDARNQSSLVSLTLALSLIAWLGTGLAHLTFGSSLTDARARLNPMPELSVVSQ